MISSEVILPNLLYVYCQYSEQLNGSTIIIWETLIFTLNLFSPHSWIPNPFTVHHIIIHSLQYEHMFDVQSLLFCAELNVKVRTVGVKCNIVSDGWGENKIVFRLTISQTETTWPGLHLLLPCSLLLILLYFCSVAQRINVLTAT